MPSRAGAGAPLAGLVLEKREETNGDGYGEAGPRVAGAAYVHCAYKGLGLRPPSRSHLSHPSTRPRGPVRAQWAALSDVAAMGRNRSVPAYKARKAV